MRRENMLNGGEKIMEKINTEEMEWPMENILLKYRIKNMKSHLHHKDKVKNT